MGEVVPELGVSGLAIVSRPIVSGISMSSDAEERLPLSSCICAGGGGTRLLSLRGSAFNTLSGRLRSFVGEDEECRFVGSVIGLLRSRLSFLVNFSITLVRRWVFSVDPLGVRRAEDTSRSCESDELPMAGVFKGGAVDIRPRLESFRLTARAVSSGTSGLSGEERSRSPKGVTGAE